MRLALDNDLQQLPLYSKEFTADVTGNISLILYNPHMAVRNSTKGLQNDIATTIKTDIYASDDLRAFAATFCRSGPFPRYICG